MNEIECLFDENGTKYYVLKNSMLDLTNISIKYLGGELKELNKKLYFQEKLLHREEGPAIEYDNGHKKFFINGLLHNENGPAIEYADGSKSWYQNGLRHREDGPAFECITGDKEWYKNGKLHREDGPAIDLDNGDKSYYINGNKISEKQFYLEKELRESILNKNKVSKMKV